VKSDGKYFTGIQETKYAVIPNGVRNPSGFAIQENERFLISFGMTSKNIFSRHL